MALVVEDPSGQRLLKGLGQTKSTRATGRPRRFQPFTMPRWHLLACLLLVQLYYGYQTARNKLYRSFSLFMAYMHKENRPVLADTTTQRQLSHISSSSITCTLQIRSYN